MKTLLLLAALAAGIYAADYKQECFYDVPTTLHNTPRTMSICIAMPKAGDDVIFRHHAILALSSKTVEAISTPRGMELFLNNLTQKTAIKPLYVNSFSVR